MQGPILNCQGKCDGKRREFKKVGLGMYECTACGYQEMDVPAAVAEVKATTCDVSNRQQAEKEKHQTEKTVEAESEETKTVPQTLAGIRTTKDAQTISEKQMEHERLSKVIAELANALDLRLMNKYDEGRWGWGEYGEGYLINWMSHALDSFINMHRAIPLGRHPTLPELDSMAVQLVDVIAWAMFLRRRLIQGDVERKRSTKWCLISREDIRKASETLTSIINMTEALVPQGGLGANEMQEINELAASARHDIDTGLHYTEAVPDDFKEETEI